MKKHHWHAFRHEKLFEKHPQPHCQTNSKCLIFFFYNLYQYALFQNTWDVKSQKKKNLD